MIGTIDEDFAIESMAGDIILLGNSSWRIRRVEPGRGARRGRGRRAADDPVLAGRGAGAHARAVGRGRGAARRRSPTATARGEDPAPALDGRRARSIAAAPSCCATTSLAGAAALGGVPTQTRVIAERFFDDAGGMQLVIHAPFGGRINRAWGMALRKRFCRSFDFELQAAATDDGIVLSLGPQHSFPLETVFSMLRAGDVEELLIQAALQAPMFETRWRWNAMRSLALLRSRGGKRVPPALQRMRAQDLIAAVFPAQTACQDNHGGGADRDPRPPAGARDHARLPGRGDGRRGPARRAGGAWRTAASRPPARERPEPSVFAHEILNANPYAFLDDAPLEERRTRAVSDPPRAACRGRRADRRPRSGGGRSRAWPRRSPSRAMPTSCTTSCSTLGALPEAIGRARGFGELFDALVAARRAARLEGSPASTGWRPSGARWPRRSGRSAASSPTSSSRRAPARAAWPTRESALVEIVRGHLPLARPDHGGRDRGAAGRPPVATSRPRWPASRWTARRAARPVRARRCDG